jgi:hypothetical protein
MSSLLICLFAACFASLANLFFRKGSGCSTEKSSYNYYLLFFYLTSFLLSFLLSPSKEFSSFDPVMFSIGCLVGFLNIVVMWLTAQALLSGPAGLTFTFQNASGIFPGIILFCLFGPLFGFQISLFQVIGISLVAWGLFLGSKNKQNDLPLSGKWLKYALGCFLLQIFALSLIHWRCLLFASNVPTHVLIPWNLSECADAWFLPGQFGFAFFIQLAIVLYERKLFKPLEATYGALGGTANGIASFCLLISTRVAFPFEKALIFPCFAAATMIICNLWANRLYQERFNLAANCYCATGIFLGSLT